MIINKNKYNKNKNMNAKSCSQMIKFAFLFSISLSNAYDCPPLVRALVISSMIHFPFVTTMTFSASQP